VIKFYPFLYYVLTLSSMIIIENSYGYLQSNKVKFFFLSLSIYYL